MFVRNGKNVQGNRRENRKVYIAEENMMIVSKMPQRNQLTHVFLSRFYIDKLDVYDVCKIDDFLHSIVLYRIVSYRFTSRIRLSVISSYDS